MATASNFDHTRSIKPFRSTVDRVDVIWSNKRSWNSYAQNVRVNTAIIAYPLMTLKRAFTKFHRVDNQTDLSNIFTETLKGTITDED